MSKSFLVVLPQDAEPEWNADNNKQKNRPIKTRVINNLSSLTANMFDA